MGLRKDLRRSGLRELAMETLREAMRCRDAGGMVTGVGVKAAVYVLERSDPRELEVGGVGLGGRMVVGVLGGGVGGGGGRRKVKALGTSSGSQDEDGSVVGGSALKTRGGSVKVVVERVPWRSGGGGGSGGGVVDEGSDGV